MGEPKSLGIKNEALKKYFVQFFPSLRCFPEKYLHNIFVDPENPPRHVAYVCPLCVSNGIVWDEQTRMIHVTGEFSEDHFPPESVRGRFKMLVCKKCNSEAGRLFDFSLKQEMDKISFNNKIKASTLKSKSIISTITGNYSSVLKINDKNEFEIDFKPTNKTHSTFLDQWLDSSNSIWEATITIKNVDEVKVSKALLKTAYLYGFGNWGYDFVFSQSGAFIRKVLNEESDYPVKNPFFWFGKAIKDSNMENFPIGLCFIQQPEQLKGFIVNILLINKETDYRDVAGVLIPNPTNDGINDLTRFKDFIEMKGEDNISLTLSHVTENTLANGVFEGYRMSWEKANL